MLHCHSVNAYDLLSNVRLIPNCISFTGLYSLPDVLDILAQNAFIRRFSFDTFHTGKSSSGIAPDFLKSAAISRTTLDFFVILIITIRLISVNVCQCFWSFSHTSLTIFHNFFTSYLCMGFQHHFQDCRYTSIQSYPHLWAYNWKPHNSGTLHLHCTSSQNSFRSQIHKAD